MPSNFYGQVELAVSTLIFAVHDGELVTPLVRRNREPFFHRWALPGGPLEPGKDLAATAVAVMDHATGFTPRYLEQLYAFGSPTRSAGQGHVVSVVYWAAVPEIGAPVDGVQWFPVDEVTAMPLAFDHSVIFSYALQRLRRKIPYTRIAHSFLPAEFTLAQLRAVHEAVLGEKLNPANFNRQTLARGAVIDTGRRLENTPYRPPKLYRYDDSLAYSPDAATPHD
ncbi:NUDIX domain-containing protein [Corynebacterium mendelii]|uniref:NUDIX hydrolase n=1 Tax=Corynebacterium mendelii TaxID=2765362 RepID=A0A939IUP6_9CORY|nr:NUDIX domain-containing protein [Corynebacterium mendelii]MBN9645154.1 NUDIX hydrolase [Corynebacterium mendelii]